MTDVEMDRLMCRVLTDAIALDAERARDADVAFLPSGRHSAQMQRMLKNPLRWARNRNRRTSKKTVRWAAAVLLFIALSFSLVMLFSEPARAAFDRWVAEWYQTHIVYRYSGSAESLPRYELTRIPEGFTELERMEEPAFTDVLYGNEAGGLIDFYYTAMAQGGASVFVPNGNTVSELKVGKARGLLLIPQDPKSMKTLTWIHDRDGVQFTIAADLEASDMIRLAESIRREKKKLLKDP